MRSRVVPASGRQSGAVEPGLDVGTVSWWVRHGHDRRHRDVRKQRSCSTAPSRSRHHENRATSIGRATPGQGIPDTGRLPSPIG